MCNFNDMIKMEFIWQDWVEMQVVKVECFGINDSFKSVEDMVVSLDVEDDKDKLKCICGCSFIFFWGKKDSLLIKKLKGEGILG